MSQGNVQIVRRCYELWENRDWSAIPEIFDPNVEVDLSRNVFNPDVYHGHAGVERYIQAVEEVWEGTKVARVVGGYRDRGEALAAAGA
jgi:ketosteroid isomerase-like protein